jgi:hypothetical protein
MLSRSKRRSGPIASFQARSAHPNARLLNLGLNAKKTRYFASHEKGPGDSAEYPFMQPGSPISTGNDQIGVLLHGDAKQVLALYLAGSEAGAICALTVT